MGKFISNQVKIEAMQLDEENLYFVLCFMGEKPDLRLPIAQDKFRDYKRIVKEEGLKIHTLEGVMTASIGDWIIKGLQGEFYPCKPDIFEQKYRRVNEVEQVVAKFSCTELARRKWGKQDQGSSAVKLNAVTSGSEENKAFWRYTPTGQIDMHIDNPDAVEFFEPGEEYYVIFRKVGEEIAKG